jgi:hypothetical protein
VCHFDCSKLGPKFLIIDQPNDFGHFRDHVGEIRMTRAAALIT